MGQNQRFSGIVLIRARYTIRKTRVSLFLCHRTNVRTFPAYTLTCVQSTLQSAQTCLLTSSRRRRKPLRNCFDTKNRAMGDISASLFALIPVVLLSIECHYAYGVCGEPSASIPTPGCVLVCAAIGCVSSMIAEVIYHLRSPAFRRLKRIDDPLEVTPLYHADHRELERLPSNRGRFSRQKLVDSRTLYLVFTS